MAMTSIVYQKFYDKLGEMYDWRPDYYTYEKYRTWRTLWLVKRTRRIPHWNKIKLQLGEVDV